MLPTKLDVLCKRRHFCSALALVMEELVWFQNRFFSPLNLRGRNTFVSGAEKLLRLS